MLERAPLSAYLIGREGELQTVTQLKPGRVEGRQVVGMAVSVLANEASLTLGVCVGRMPTKVGLERMQYRYHQMTAALQHSSKLSDARAKVGEMREGQPTEADMAGHAAHRSGCVTPPNHLWDH